MDKKRLISVTLATLLLIGVVSRYPMATRAAGFIVNMGVDDTDAHDANPGDCICADTFTACTLRAAIEEANACPGIDTITFQTAMAIEIDSGEGALPSLDEQVTIDASSVWDTVNDKPGVTIDGQGGSFSDLYLGAGMCEIYGLHITDFGGYGIDVASAANQIGGTATGQRNVLSGNRNGIGLLGSSTKLNVLHNNFIGLAPDGDTANPNLTGLFIGNGASGNTIGGQDAAQANLISGNTSDGVMIEDSTTDNNRLIGNVIGLTADLSTKLGNGSHGVRIQDGANNTVIGGASQSGNLIVHNTYSGIYVLNAGSGTEISHNVIGSNMSDGISIQDSSGCVVSDNVISGNTFHGVRVFGASATGNLIWPNSITNNNEKGIHLKNGANMSITVPLIDSASAVGAAGTVCAGCRVAIYSDSDDEGQVYHDIVQADGTGMWTYTDTLHGPNVTATAIDISGNTSEFSAPFSIHITAPSTVTLNGPAQGVVGKRYTFTATIAPPTTTPLSPTPGRQQGSLRIHV